MLPKIIISKIVMVHTSLVCSRLPQKCSHWDVTRLAALFGKKMYMEVDFSPLALRRFRNICFRVLVFSILLKIQVTTTVRTLKLICYFIRLIVAHSTDIRGMWCDLSIVVVIIHEINVRSQRKQNGNKGHTKYGSNEID